HIFGDSFKSHSKPQPQAGTTSSFESKANSKSSESASWSFFDPGSWYNPFANNFGYQNVYTSYRPAYLNTPLFNVGNTNSRFVNDPHWLYMGRGTDSLDKYF